jgi:formate dehydrogenase iron-sulfur subunit
MKSPITVFVPRDATALSLGADKVAQAIVAEAAARNIEVKLVRNGSRGLFWLEPLVEVATSAGRVAYGPVKARDVAGLFDAGFLEGKEHALGHGLTEEIDYLKRQERLTFARAGITDPLSLDDYIAHDGYRGLKRALGMTPEAIVAEVTESGLRGRARLPGRTEVHRLQRRRRRLGHLLRPHGDGGRPLCADRRHDHRRSRRRRD